ncbi:MAG: CDP-glucose 4,6-dehydratase [Rhodospirillales bacterium]|nr:CDP-glucose 4,6-dehydratase [Rhodospirillales bacterium]MDE2318510.1 CDP-glucose 4,6-dehydratase [Rhodospirillales bacterium]
MLFWQGRRVFVTGHTGFKGAWLCAWLKRLGAEAAGFALPAPAGKSLCLQMQLEGKMSATHGDIRNGRTLAATIAEFQPEVIFHLAAQPLVVLSYSEPVETFATNVMGTVNVLEAVRRTPSIRAAVIVTSDKCYENHGPAAAYSEVDRLGGDDPYSASKACAELVTQAWRHSFFLPDGGAAIASVRAGNVIGGGDWAENRLVPDCIAAFGQGRPIVLRNPDACRPWQHVLDALCGYLLVAERLVAGDASAARAWNFGPASGPVVTVAEIVQRLAALWGAGAGWSRGAAPTPYEAAYLAVDSSLARSALNWLPRLALPQALNWTAAWYRREHDGEDAARLVAEQLSAYEANAEILA